MARPIPVMLMVRELNLGGCERDLTRLALGMDRDRFEPHVACFLSRGVRGDELRAAGVPILELPVRSFRDSSAVRGARMMRRYIRENGIRVIQALDVPAVIFGVPVAKLAGVDAVIPCTLGHRELYSALERRLLRVSDFLGDRLIVNSQRLIDHLVDQRLIRREKTALVYNGIDTEIFQPPADSGTRRAILPQRLADGALLIGSICALRPEKDLGTLIEAFSRVSVRRPDVRLAVVGSGGELERLQAATERLGVAGRCHFEPFTAEVAAWLHAMDVFVLSSSSESFPNSLLEAMACGTSAVASRVGGVPEMAADGERALLFDAGDVAGLAERLERLIDDSELRRRLARAAREFVCRELTVERFVARTEAAYEAVLTEKGRMR